MPEDLRRVLEGVARWYIDRCVYQGLADSLPEGSVQLLWLDPPYFRVVDEPWDRAWKTEAEYLTWLRGVVRCAARLLAPNGSVYLWASTTMGARVECIAARRLRVLNAIVWAKNLAKLPPGDPRAAALRVRDPDQSRVWVSFAERVIFAESQSPPVSPVAARILALREGASLSRDALAIAIGRTVAGDPTRGTGLVNRWEEGACVPTPEDWCRLLAACGDTRSDVERLGEREGLIGRLDATRRPFVAPKAFSDVWTYAPPPPDPARHICEKPVDMLTDIVTASSRPGDLVCDLFGGSFRMAEVALRLGRRYVGCDIDPHWVDVGKARAAAEAAGTHAPAAPRRARKQHPGQGVLF